MRIMISCLALLAVTGAFAAEPVEPPAATVVVCTSIQDNSCAGAASKFSADVGKLWGFSQVSNVPVKLIHVWFYRDKELGRVELPVKAAHWRTWSNITVSKNMVGPWRLEARDAAGKVLASYSFTIE
ncbi:MAG: DUF2914 domain-containing protein [Thermoanaerobaculaceae bacterium]|nr:DUF2914 domain-containing protein [Thermoanaerobaculaceae bacterium]